MAIKNVVIPWISGGALLLGYAAFAWLRGQRGRAAGPASAPDAPAVLDAPEPHDALAGDQYERAPLLDQLKRVPEELALDSEAEPASPANSNGAARHAELGALFLGRATSALSRFQNDPNWAPLTSTGTGKL